MGTEFKIYVADLAAYNNGKLHGVWIDVLEDDIQARINDMLKTSPEGFAEEWAIHDYEGFGDVSLSEYQGIESVREIAAFLQEYTEFGAKLLDYSGSISQAQQYAIDGYHGLYDDLEDYARRMTEDTAEIPDHLANYIDYERMGRDMELSGDIFTIEVGCNEMYVFSAH